MSKPSSRVHPGAKGASAPAPASAPATSASSSSGKRPPLAVAASALGAPGGSSMSQQSLRKISKISTEGNCTTIAVGNDTYTIVASRKGSGGSLGSGGVGSVGGGGSGGGGGVTGGGDHANNSPCHGATNIPNESQPIETVTNGGETIRIFRRSRSGRPSSTTRVDSIASGFGGMTMGVTTDEPGGVAGGGSNSPLNQQLSAETTTTQSSTSSPGAGAGGAGGGGGGSAYFGSGPGSGHGSGHGSDDPDDEVLKLEDMPAPDSVAGTKEAFLKLKQLVSKLKENTIDPETLVSNLEYVTDVVQAVVAKTEDETEDDLSELQSEAVPAEVRKWLASTFAKQEAPTRRRSDERPSFKSVANAIRTGIFIERIYRRMSSSQLMIIPPEVQKALKQSDDWTFDTFSFGLHCKGSPLRFLGYELLTRNGCLHKFKINPTVLETMLVHVEMGYANNGNPYHNHMHACEVLQTIHYFISQTGIANWLSDLDIFTSLLAAIVHDFDHSGTTNNFHVNSGSNLAILYNDRAVLENHHVSEFFKTLQKNDCNIFANMQKQDFRDFRNLIIEMVLHTDMTQHFSQLKTMKGILAQHNGEPTFDKTKVLCLLLHTCDVAHPAKRWDYHHQWTARCIEEFFEQGDREAELGLEYTPLCDRHNTMVPQSQIGFIDVIVKPTLGVLGDVLESILRSLELANKKSSATSTGAGAGGQSSLKKATIQEEGGSGNGGGSGGGGGTNSSESASGNGAGAADEPNQSLLKRPWLDNLTINRAHWQEKHDAGERGIEPSGADQDLRPSSVTSITGKSRPNSATTAAPSEAGTASSTSTPTPTPLPATTIVNNNNNNNNHHSASNKNHSDGSSGSASSSSGGSSSASRASGASGSSATSGQIVIDSQPPEVDTKLEDILEDLSPLVISRPHTPPVGSGSGSGSGEVKSGSESTWGFSEKENPLKVAPPRPHSATLCSPPMPRKVPISVDHHLRK